VGKVDVEGGELKLLHSLDLFNVELVFFHPGRSVQMLRSWRVRKCNLLSVADVKQSAQLFAT
jgi:hypothetical protein